MKKGEWKVARPSWVKSETVKSVMKRTKPQRMVEVERKSQEIGEVALLIIFTIKLHGSSAHIVMLRRGIGWCFTSLTLRNVHCQCPGGHVRIP